MAAPAKRMGIKLDPRAEIILLVLTNIIAFSQHNIHIEIAWVVILLLMSIVCGCTGTAAKLGSIFAICLMLQYVVLPRGPKWLAGTLSVLVSYSRKFFPCLIVGSLMVQKTSLRQMMTALRKWHVPEGLIIALSVTVRYFPAIKEEVIYIKDAMKLRGVQGMQKVEGLLIPIMISATNTADELSAAAVTRGIENPKIKTTIIEMKWKVQDSLCLLISVLFCILTFVWG